MDQQGCLRRLGLSLEEEEEIFPIHKQVFDATETAGAVGGKAWIEISRYQFGSKKSHLARQRKRVVLKDKSGAEVHEDVPFHSLLYQLLNSKEVPREIRRNLFLGMSVRPNPDKDSKRPPTLAGAQRWDKLKKTLQTSSYESLLKKNDERTIQVRESHEMVSALSVLSAIEFASRIKPKQLSGTNDLSGPMKPNLKQILSENVDFPVAAHERSYYYYGRSVPSIDEPYHLECSEDAVGIQLTQEFLNFYCLVRDPAYYESRMDEEEEDDVEDDDDEYDLDVDAFMADEEVVTKRAKQVVVKYPC